MLSLVSESSIRLDLLCATTDNFFFIFIFVQPVEFTTGDAELLFGPDADYKAAFEELDTDEDGEVNSEKN